MPQHRVVDLHFQPVLQRLRVAEQLFDEEQRPSGDTVRFELLAPLFGRPRQKQRLRFHDQLRAIDVPPLGRHVEPAPWQETAVL